MKSNEMQIGTLYRSMTVETTVVDGETRSMIDEEARTVVLAFSSETEEVERWFDFDTYGVEILDHDKGSAKLERLKDAGSLLVDHDPRDVVGVIEKVEISDDRRGRASVRFGNSARANEIFRDVVEGIRKTVSFGYKVNSLKWERKRDDGVDVYRATSWTPSEISLVSIPADTSAGVARDQKADDLSVVEITREQKREEEPVKVENTPTAEPVAVDENAIREAGRLAERTRMTGIRSIADKVRGVITDVDELVSNFADNGRSLNDFQAAIIEKVDAVQERAINNAQDNADIGMSKKDVREYSLSRLINAQATGNYKDAGLELEASEAVADQLGREANGRFVPYDVLASDETRANRTSLTAGVATGDNLIETVHAAGSFIDVLRNKSVLGAMGARLMPGLVGDVDIPRMDSGNTFAFIDNETYNTTGAESIPTFSTVNLTPHTLRGRCSVTRKMLKQSSPYVEGIIRDDLAIGIGLAMDAYGFTGDGTGANPTGILNAAGVGVVYIDANGGSIDWDAVVDAESELFISNADAAKMGYVTNAKVRGAMKKTVVAAGGSVVGFIMDKDGSVNGYPCMVSNQIPSNLVRGTSGAVCSPLLFGDFSQMLVGLWGGLDIEPDKTTLGDKGALILRVFQDCDFALRHSESFAYVGDILT